MPRPAPRVATATNATLTSSILRMIQLSCGRLLIRLMASGAAKWRMSCVGKVCDTLMHALIVRSCRPIFAHAQPLDSTLGSEAGEQSPAEPNQPSPQALETPLQKRDIRASAVR